MKVVLLEDVKGLGSAGDVCEVSPGYATNFLYKKKLAMPLSKDALNEVTTRQRAEKAKAEKAKEQAEAWGNQLKGRIFTLTLKGGAEGKLYGAVTAMDVAQLLAEEGFTVDKRHIQFKEAVKTTGLHDLTVRLHADVQVPIVLNVVATKA
ncbi:MAG TPA: 50S ribosomal protein L9 [Clostridiaceae bacterium]|jgi:large subunit ribosomal protein L9|nr:50S ribosomal protein L9 [Clostridiaceae bacterium]